MILSLSKNNHDASYCILNEEGKIIYFSQEERFSRKKHSSFFNSEFAEHVKERIKFFNIKKLHTVLISNSLCTNKEPMSLFNFIKNLDVTVCFGKLNNKDHHKSHAFCGYSFSSFDNAVCLVIDGWGSKFKIDNFVGYESTSIFEIEKQKIKTLYKKINYDSGRFKIVNSKFIKDKIKYDLDITHRLDLGVMYGTVSRHLGFNSLDAGKTMGLASWGKQNEKIPNMLLENKFCNMNLFKNDRTLDTEYYPFLKNLSFDEKKDLAYAMQQSLEKYFINCMEYISSKSKIKNIILSGGCALNVMANSALVKNFPKYNFFVDPLASDAGQSIGHAKMYYSELEDLEGINNYNKSFKEKDVYLNTCYNKDTILNNLKKYEIDS